MSAIRVVLVDDHVGVARGFQALIEASRDIQVVGIARTAEEALLQLSNWRPDIVVMDFSLPGGMNGIEAIQHIGKQLPDLRVILLTGFPDGARFQAALRAGARAIVLKNGEGLSLVEAVHAVASGRIWIDPQAASLLAEDVMRGGNAGNRLTDRELQVLPFLVRGQNNAAIARAMGLGEETVKSHVSNILTKLGLASRNEIPWFAIKHRLVNPDELEDKEMG